jgi:hypothetical protein
MTTCIVAASGWSLRNPVDQVPLIEAARAVGLAHVIVVNNSWQCLPNADVLYAADGPWWDVHHAAVEAGFGGERWTAHADAAKRYGLCHIRVDQAIAGLSRVPGVLAWGQNGGYQAIGLAYKFGARKIILCGFDMAVWPDGRKHWHGDHTAGLANGDPSGWVRNFDQLGRDLDADGVQVANCSARTALTCFRRADLAETLAAL